MDVFFSIIGASVATWLAIELLRSWRSSKRLHAEIWAIAFGAYAVAMWALAFGLGVDRLAMLKYGIPDLRPFFEADMRWLKHYGFKPLDLPTLAGGISR